MYISKIQVLCHSHIIFNKFEQSKFIKKFPSLFPPPYSNRNIDLIEIHRSKTVLFRMKKTKKVDIFIVKAGNNHVIG